MNWYTLPHTFGCEEQINDLNCLYFIGGYHSIPTGCDAWGTSDRRRNRFIGDRMGSFLIEYTNGVTDEIPIILGYNLWFKEIWRENCAPFKSEEAVSEMTETLKKALCLLDAFEGLDKTVLRVLTKPLSIKNVTLIPNSEKEGCPVFDGFYLTCGDDKTILTGGSRDVNAADSFFDSHTVSCADAYPIHIINALKKINDALLTYEDDYRNAPDYNFHTDRGASGFRLRFSGDRLAEIANGVVYCNTMNLSGRVDPDGMVHTTYKDAPSWRYEGFGGWVPKANSYYDSYYSRDGARALMVLGSLGDRDAADRGARYGNNCMMYFPENSLTIMRKKIPGHYTVIINKPLIYSTVLVPVANWPTRYTRELFGDDYQNIGNHETDGHGLMMMANYCVCRNSDNPAKWAYENWTYLKEGADWIIWCLDNPDVSLSENGLLYSETEAGMNDFTLYCNGACWFGLKAYAVLASDIGKIKECEIWTEYAAKLETAILKYLTFDGRWDTAHLGFMHDSSVTFLSDIYGYDKRDMPEDWVKLSEETYEDDIKRFRGDPPDIRSGIGYNISMMVQSALLHDKIKEADYFMRLLTKICYAPRLPEPYMVPEGISLAADLGAARRQGDLGNLVQQAEALKCYLIAAGISPVHNRTLKIIPRLPIGWKLELNDFKVQNTRATVDFSISYPSDGKQYIQVSLRNADEIDRVMVRFGPFADGSQSPSLILNGNPAEAPLYKSGDYYFADVTYTANK